MDGTSITHAKSHLPAQVWWRNCEHKQQPMQMWLKVGATDRAANYEAYRSAMPWLKDEQCQLIFALCDEAQAHFITHATFLREDGTSATFVEAYEEARQEHLRLDGDPAVVRGRPERLRRLMEVMRGQEIAFGNSEESLWRALGEVEPAQLLQVFSVLFSLSSGSETYQTARWKNAAGLLAWLQSWYETGELWPDSSFDYGCE